ncbi:deoxyribodipyrimidine photo-lyase [Ruegeria intermedia]|uniref:deoxyribodipyrimidine photo-lyase n=1 Tax=Ruegeria intermedia TaxID=996115 RepID=UPI00122D0F8B
MAGRTSLQVVCFKRDLRASDNSPLSRAIQHGPVLPLHIVEPALWRLEDASGRQFAFRRGHAWPPVLGEVRPCSMSCWQARHHARQDRNGELPSETET